MAAGEVKEGSYDEILLAIVERLHQTVKGCNDSTCYLALDPDEVLSSPGHHVVIVAPLSSRFREGAFVGGGLNHLAAESGCIVKIHCPSLTDQKSRDAQAITSESKGLIRKSSAVLGSLSATGAGPLPGASWAPTKDDYARTSPFRPVGFSLHKNENGAIRSIELTFAFDFDWDVTHQ